MTSFDTHSPTMRTPFRPSALPPTAKLLMLVGLLALPSALLTAFRSGRPMAPMAGATVSIDNSTDCAYVATIFHSNNCPATSLLGQNTLNIPASTNGSSITVAGTIVNKIEVRESGVLIATWTCTSGTSGSWAPNSDRCEYAPPSNLFARLQGNGYSSNKIDWEP